MLTTLTQPQVAPNELTETAIVTTVPPPSDCRDWIVDAPGLVRSACYTVCRKLQ